jgi:hypothetical protein
VKVARTQNHRAPTTYPGGQKRVLSPRWSKEGSFLMGGYNVSGYNMENLIMDHNG